MSFFYFPTYFSSGERKGGKKRGKEKGGKRERENERKRVTAESYNAAKKNVLKILLIQNKYDKRMLITQ